MVTRRRSAHKIGVETLSVSRRGDCHVYRWRPGLELDCWGGRRSVASATYQFRLPAGFSNGRWEVHGRRGCCSPGAIDFDARRVNDRAVRVMVTVTNWRSYQVREVQLTYSYRTRI